MTYVFQINNQTLIGNTMSGSARIQVHQHATGQFIAAFEPDVASLITDKPSGKWIDVSANLTPEQLKQLHPLLLDAARSRLLAIREKNQRALLKNPKLLNRLGMKGLGLQ